MTFLNTKQECNGLSDDISIYFFSDFFLKTLIVQVTVIMNYVNMYLYIFIVIKNKLFMTLLIDHLTLSIRNKEEKGILLHTMK